VRATIAPAAIAMPDRTDWSMSRAPSAVRLRETLAQVPVVRVGALQDTAVEEGGAGGDAALRAGGVDRCAGERSRRKARASRWMV
jgi:hypothetical protein